MRFSAKNCSKAHENAKKVRFGGKKHEKARIAAEAIIPPIDNGFPLS
jgi:hypothetical protein